MKPTRNILLSILAAAVLIQLLIITYNHATGFIHVGGTREFLLRLGFGSVFTALFGAAVFFIDAAVITRLDRGFPWHGRPLPRTGIELFTVVMIGIAAGALVTVVVHLIAPYADGLAPNVVTNALITAVLNLIIVAVLEALFWYRRGQEAQLEAERLARENLQMRFATLKQQLNPHFLFNSLNTLSSLIGTDDERAQEFVDEFSSVYRYTLEVIDRPLVTLEEEMRFVRGYLALQRTRFGSGVDVATQIDGVLLRRMVPPLAVQTLLENAFKHNSAAAESPLRIRITAGDGTLVVRNRLQARRTRERCSGVGLENLRKRYALVSDREPRVTVTDEEFIVSLPLIE